MRMMAFSGRNGKEILRDPINLLFGLAFPVALLLLFAAINAGVPAGVSVFPIDRMAPGVSVFSFSFLSMFSGLLLAKDRSTAFLMRLFASPLTAWDFIFGYTLPLIPMGLAQAVLCFATSAFLGLPVSANMLLAVVVVMPASLLFIAIGMLFGSLFNDRQVGGLCGGLLTNVTALLSGAWFDLSLVGGAFETIAYLLPFAHAVDAARSALNGEYADILPHLVWVLGYAAVLMVAAVLVFRQKMKSEKV